MHQAEPRVKVAVLLSWALIAALAAWQLPASDVFWLTAGQALGIILMAIYYDL